MINKRITYNYHNNYGLVMEKHGYTFLQSMLLNEAINYLAQIQTRLVANAIAKSPQSVNPTS